MSADTHAVPLERQFRRAQGSMTDTAEVIFGLVIGILDHPEATRQRDVSRLISMANALGEQHTHWMGIRHALSEERRAAHAHLR